MLKLQVITLVALTSLLTVGCKDFTFTVAGDVEVAEHVDDYNSDTVSIHYGHGGQYGGHFLPVSFRAYLDLELQADKSVAVKLELPDCNIEAVIGYDLFKELDSRSQLAPKKLHPENVAVTNAGDELITRTSRYGDKETTYLKQGENSRGKLVFADSSKVRALVDKIIDELSMYCDNQKNEVSKVRISEYYFNYDEEAEHRKQHLNLSFQDSLAFIKGAKSWTNATTQCIQEFGSEKITNLNTVAKLQNLAQQIQLDPSIRKCQASIDYIMLPTAQSGDTSAEIANYGDIYRPTSGHSLEVEITYTDGSVRCSNINQEPNNKILGLNSFMTTLDQWMQQQPGRCESSTLPTF